MIDVLIWYDGGIIQNIYCSIHPVPIEADLSPGDESSSSDITVPQENIDPFVLLHLTFFLNSLISYQDKMIPCFVNFFEGGKSRSITKHKYKLLPDLALQGAILKIIGKAIFLL